MVELGMKCPRMTRRCCFRVDLSAWGIGLKVFGCRMRRVRSAHRSSCRRSPDLVV